MADSIKSEQTHEFFKAIENLKNAQDVQAFFEDICTEREIKSMVQRFEVAKMLLQRCVYTEIVHATGASTATISRVKRCLNNGNGGYEIGMDGLKK